MATLTRKQREIAERERLILDTAAGMVAERGYLGLTMDRIADATEYSKGTIYQHFGNKEEILAALAIETSERRVALFEKATTFRGRARERMAAIGVADDLFVKLYPLHHRCETVIGAHSIRDKASPERIHRLEDCEFKCMSVVLGLVGDAIAAGDLDVDEGDEHMPQRIVLGLWSMASGYQQLTSIADNPIETKLGFEEPVQALFSCYDRFLDGFGWRPFSSEWDYPKTLERIHDEVFSDELRRIRSA